jgi:endonuclease G
MATTRIQRFGLITFFVLLVLVILVTNEPWRKAPGKAAGALSGAESPLVELRWAGLESAHPSSPFADSILRYKGFDLAYNESHEQATWVAYVLTRQEVAEGRLSRSNDFRPDRSLPMGSAALDDYRGSGFDRGHLAPAADMKWDSLAMSESFLMSNMSPQEPAFNQGIWRKLEEQVRRWALEKDSIYVISGPVLAQVKGHIGENQVSIPGYYFKVLVDLSPPDHSFIAFLLPNERAGGTLDQYAVSVDSLEVFSGIDFFARAPQQELIQWLEARYDLTQWN